MSISIGLIARENYLLKNPEMTTIQGTEIRVRDFSTNTHEVRVYINFFNTTDEDKFYSVNDFSVTPSEVEMQYVNYSFSFSISAKNSETKSFYIVTKDSMRFKFSNVGKIKILHLGQIIATIRI